jgi:hypothetical protein
LERLGARAQGGSRRHPAPSRRQGPSIGLRSRCRPRQSAEPFSTLTAAITNPQIECGDHPHQRKPPPRA